MRAYTVIFAYQIAIGNEYEHSPLTHGMFLFELIAGMFFLFGDSDFTLRLGMVLFGSALILVPLLLRKRLGDTGALLTSAMLTFSPALFYFSRFARNDILMALFIAVLVVAMWRYVEERRYRWFYITAAVLAISDGYQRVGIHICRDFRGLLRLGDSIRDTRHITGHYEAQRVKSCRAPSSCCSSRCRRRFSRPGLRYSKIFVGLTLAAVEGTPGVPTGAPDGATAIAVAAFVTLLVFGVGVAIGAWWNWRRFWVALAIFWAIYAGDHDQFRQSLCRRHHRRVAIARLLAGATGC